MLAVAIDAANPDRKVVAENLLEIVVVQIA